MIALARYDFEKGSAPRLNKNFYYMSEYGNCYAIAAANDYFTGI